MKVMEEAGLMLFTGFTYRFSGSAKEIHRLIRSGAIGEVRATAAQLSLEPAREVELE
jgi:predicted dehydrogenase